MSVSMHVMPITKKNNADLGEELTPTIQRTKNYSIFKPMQGNRKISETHVRRLVNFIGKRNLLPYNPILVDDNLEVIDGQHRLEAAKTLGTYIYYIVADGLNYRDAGILNACTDDWEFKEFLDAYVKNDHQEYIKLQDFLLEHNINLSRCRFLMSPEQKENFDEKFKIGEFEIIDNLSTISQDIKKVEEIVTYLDEIIVSKNRRFIFSDSLWRSLYYFLIKKDVDIERFKEKIGTKHQSIKPMSGYKDYLTLFREIYNWKAKQRLK